MTPKYYTRIGEIGCMAEYWNGRDWKPLDSTQDFSGNVKWKRPDDWALAVLIEHEDGTIEMRTVK